MSSWPYGTFLKNREEDVKKTHTPSTMDATLAQRIKVTNYSTCCFSFTWRLLQALANVFSWRWLLNQRTPIKLEEAGLGGQTVVVTGGNKGIGLEAAKHFACMNVGRLILACRDVSAGELAVRTIRETPGCNSNSIVCWPLDLSSFESVCAFATRFREERRPLNVLVCNAGCISCSYSQTPDGWEKMLQANYLSNALLVMLLVPAFAGVAQESRIIMLTSDSHAFIRRVEEDDKVGLLRTLNNPVFCKRSIGTRYFLTQLFIILFTRELARRRVSAAPIAMAVNPGYCTTNLDSEFKAKPIQRYMTRAADHLIARTAEMGSRTIIHAAASSELHDGGYLANGRLERESDFARSEEGRKLQERLWDETMFLLCQLDSRVRESLRGL
ncbi:hypothetical protein FB45DRAFT_6922 [Roridomyces roridus]|uniref:Uncharacterized protein n=1 Tax=Roridomyces roridus TaxID=1738132 RepID=A0AAD7CIE6_9AGAR|nr:hypothetical protein FB45DRAFT_6922 [Roridomyces roridus]